MKKKTTKAITTKQEWRCKQKKTPKSNGTKLRKENKFLTFFFLTSLSLAPRTSENTRDRVREYWLKVGDIFS